MSLRDAFLRWLCPLRRKGFRCAPMNTVGYASVPLPPFTPGFVPLFLGKAHVLSRFRRGFTKEEPTMKDLNAVQLLGHLGHDPEVQYSAKGVARTTFSVATHRTWTDADGQAQTATAFEPARRGGRPSSSTRSAATFQVAR